MLFIVRFFFAPIYFLGFIFTSILIVQADKSILLLIPLLVSAILISFMVEKVLPYEPKWNQPRNDQRCNLLHALVNEVSTAIAIALIPLLTIIPIQYDLWPNDWPLWAQLVFSILIADFGITMAHYFSHKVPLLWKFHCVHHSVKRMYGFNGLMKHPLHQMFELIIGTMPLILIGIPIEVGALLAFAVAIQLTLQHSNVDMRVGSFSYIWAVATSHRHHHLASKEDGNVNFGLFTMIWDHFLGTFEIKRATPYDGEIGIDGQFDFPTNYIAQLSEPFKQV